MHALQRPATLVITLPRREFASGLVALGVVARQEHEEWQRVSDGALTLSLQDRVSFARLYGDRVQHGSVDAIGESSIRVLKANSTDVFEFRGEQRAVIVRKIAGEPETESRLSQGLCFLEALLGRIRSRSFCLRRHIDAVVLGNESRALAEWQEFPLLCGGSRAVLTDLLRPTRLGQNDSARTACVSDRTALFAPDAAGEAVLVFDGERSWRRWSRAAELHKRVLVIDRSIATFDSLIEQLRAEVSGPSLGLSVELEPPRGMEAYAFAHVRRGKL